MRKMASSGKTLWSTSLSSRADSRSRPNGFSTTTRLPSPLSPTRARPCTTSSNIDGGMAR